MYEPQVNDYVKWVTELGQVHEGWVYFKADSTEERRGWKKPSRYITIEIATKPKKDHSVIYQHSFINVFMFVYVVMNQIGMN